MLNIIWPVREGIKLEGDQSRIYKIKEKVKSSTL